MVYGIGVLVCAIALVPLRIQLVKRRKTVWGAALEFFVITVLVCMAMEFAMGFLLNQPDAADNYPLCQKALAKVPIRVMRPVAAIVVVGFVVLCVVKFA